MQESSDCKSWMKVFLVLLVLFPILSQAQTSDTLKNIPKHSVPPPPPPLPPPLPKPKNLPVYKKVTRHPQFPNCAACGWSEEEKRACTREKLLEYVYKNLYYPFEAKHYKVAGIAVAEFIVEKNGKISSCRIVEDIGHGCGYAVCRAINTMNERGLKWTPSGGRGRAVRLRYTLEVPIDLR